MNKFSVPIFLIAAALFVIGCIDNTKTQEQEIQLPRPAGSRLTGTSFSNVYLSRNGGLQWEPFASGIPENATVSAFHFKNNTIYAATDSHGIYSIKSGEATWKRIDELPETSGRVNVDHKCHYLNRKCSGNRNIKRWNFDFCKQWQGLATK